VTCECGGPLVEMVDGTQFCGRTLDRYEALYGQTKIYLRKVLTVTGYYDLMAPRSETKQNGASHDDTQQDRRRPQRHRRSGSGG
jgi:hypothetical protein